MYEDGRQIRDFVNIRDVVAANLLVLESAADDRVFNVGGGRAYTVLEFAETVRRVFGRDAPPRLSNEFRFGDTRHIVSDIGKLEALGWTPTRTPEDNVAEYRAWLEKQADVDDVLDYAERRMKEMAVVRQACTPG